MASDGRRIGDGANDLAATFTIPLREEKFTIAQTK